MRRVLTRPRVTSREEQGDRALERRCQPASQLPHERQESQKRGVADRDVTVSFYSPRARPRGLHRPFGTGRSSRALAPDPLTRSEVRGVARTSALKVTPGRGNDPRVLPAIEICASLTRQVLITAE